MDATIAMRAGRTNGEADTSRLKRRKGDAVIGATADVEDEPVLTRNDADFETLGFEVQTYQSRNEVVEFSPAVVCTDDSKRDEDQRQPPNLDISGGGSAPRVHFNQSY